MALHALSWILSDADRAGRFLALTGLTPDGLREAAGTAAGQRAVIGFLAGHEADLVACADAIGIAPAALAGARP